MDRVIEHAAARDVHKASVTACARTPGKRGKRLQELAEFKTTVRGLLALRAWLAERGVTAVAMEATGVYWKPVWAVLEDEFDLLLCNATHVKNVPGRKTDMADAQWLCQLLECGLLRASFVPPKPIRELRELTRRRRTLIEDRKREVQRLHKTLEDTGIKLDCVVTDVLGVSGRRMLAALIAGTNDPDVLAELAKGRLRAKLPDLREALQGRFNAQHALLTDGILRHIDFLDGEIEALTTAIERHMADQAAPEAARAPQLEAAVRLACSLDGIQERTAQMLLGEFGTDMSRFPTHKHFASWAGRCPGNHESAGKRRSGRMRPGPRHLNQALNDAAMAAIRVKDGHFARKYRRVKARSGHGVALGAVKHAMLVALYHMLSNGELYRAPSPNPERERQARERAVSRLVAKLEALGQSVTLTATASG
jgi:transposase